MKLLRSFKPNPHRRGMTLVETIFGVVIASLLMLGTLNLYMTSATTTLTVGAQIAAGQDASNAVQQIIQATREAQSFSLPNELPSAGGAFVVPTGFTAGSLQTTLNGENIYTALEIVQPPTMAVTVANGAGLALAVAPAPLNRDGTSAATLLFYRADAGGVADAAAGQYLWAYSVQDGGASVNRAICKSVDTNTPNAVQFVRPYVGSPAVPQPYDVEVKVVSGYYSLTNGQQTSEETNGSNTSQISGKCVLMRDHANNVATGGTNESTNNNAFRFH